MIFNAEIWNSMSIEQKKLFIDRLVNHFNIEHSILFVHKLFTHTLIESIDIITLDYQDYIVDQLYKTSKFSLPKTKDFTMRDMFFIIDDENSSIHLILDDYNNIIHINSDRLKNVNHIRDKFISTGNILQRLDIKKNKNLFKFRFYKSYKVVSKTLPIWDN